MFQEPTVGSVELVDDYDKLWAAVLDETTNSVSGDSMMTAQEGWNSDQEERNQAVVDQQEDEVKIQSKNLDQLGSSTRYQGQESGTR